MILPQEEENSFIDVQKLLLVLCKRPTLKKKHQG